MNFYKLSPLINISDMYARKRKLEQNKVFISMPYSEIYKKINREKDFMVQVASTFIDATPISYLWLLEIMQDMSRYNQRDYEYIALFFAENCLLYYHDMDSVLEEVETSNINDQTKTSIKRYIEYISKLDRLIFNHESILKRFDLYSIFDSTGYKYKIIVTICQWINTYNYPDIVKIKLCIDEFFILNHFNEKIELEIPDSVFIIVLFYMIQSANDGINITSYLDEANLHLKQYTDDSINTNRLRSIDNIEYLKHPRLLNEINPKDVDIDDIIDIFIFLYVYAEVFNLEDTNFNHCIGNLLSNVQRDIILEGVKFMSDKIETKIFIDTEEKNFADDIIVTTIATTGEEILDTDIDTKELAQIKHFANDILKTADDSIRNQPPISLTKEGEYGSIEAISIENFTDYVDEDGRIRVLISRYRVDKESFIDNYDRAKEYIRYLVNMLNNRISNQKYCVQIIASFTMLDIYLVSTYTVNLDIDVNKDFNDTTYREIFNIKRYADEFSDLAKKYKNEIENILFILNSPDNHLAEIIEINDFKAINDIICIIFGTNEIMEPFMQNIRNKNKSFVKKAAMNDIYNNTKPLDYKPSLEIVGFAISELNKILTDYNVVKEGNILNSVQLAWQGIKSKAKSLSAKQKEMTRDMDMSFNGFMRSMKKALTGDRREQIIRGEVCPSLSKIINGSIALIVSGVVTGSLAVPAIGAFAWLALSKHVTNKEVGMIVDEIDIELKVLDREVQKAENSGSSSKYRKLLTIQKKLLRERQRIQYKYALGGKSIRPISYLNKGVATND